MQNLLRPLPRGINALDALARRPLCRSLAFWLAASGTGLYAHGLNATPATATPAAVSSVPSAPTPNTGAYSQSNQGTNASDQSSTTGGTPPDIDYELTADKIAGSGDSNPTIYLGTTGGTGGTGQDNNTSYGGAGGTGGNLALTMDAGAGVVSGSTAGAAVVLSSNGGQGATAGAVQDGNMPGQPGHGGDGGNAQMDQYGSVWSTNGWSSGGAPGTTAVLLESVGGNAAQPLNTVEGTDVSGPAGAAGGNGGNISYNLHQGAVTSAGAGIVTLSLGGQAGDGTPAYGGSSHGGSGGTGGNGGTIDIMTGTPGEPAPIITATGASTAATGATVPVNATGTTAQAALMAAGIQAQSLGGLGGNGGTASGGSSTAGSGGAAGNGGGVQVSMGSTNISTTGFAAAGVLAQSVGGAGGDGTGAGGIFYKKSGSGGVGGNAGDVNVALWEWTGTEPASVLKTAGDDSMGIVAQSIGGGGGAGGAVSGGSAFAGVAIGGSGETGGAGGVVTLYNGYPGSGPSEPYLSGEAILTRGGHSSALVAQSIGGGGGSGGSATNSDLGAFTYTVGGNGGSGGSAGTPGTMQVTAYNNGVVNTSGNHAKGLLAQAVGGGGGDGGSATALSASVLVNTTVTVGGNGGSGGTSGDVYANNGGNILTSGSDAWGMLAQSVAGGGGNGGMTKSDAFNLAINGAPNVSVDVAIGGAGGDGAASGNVNALNNGGIMTGGDAAHGIMAQSVSGGGGTGGDSSSDLVVAGKGNGLTVNVSMGGSGGKGGTSGNVAADNAVGGLVWTLGDSADGIFAQSVAGGGGAGGTGKQDTYFLGSSGQSSGKFTETLGGTGGDGSFGGSVNATNEGDILTIGDSSNGIFAQSVADGGGMGTGGSAKGSVGKQSFNITLSGTNNNNTIFTGIGGDGGAVNATNSGNIVTYGGDAAGIEAQSVGGGGGTAGTGATSGLPSSAGQLTQYLTSSTALSGYLRTYAGGALGFAAAPTTMSALEAWANDYLTYAAANPDAVPADGTGASYDAALLVGGGSNLLPGTTSKDSVIGDGGTVTASNNASIATFGAGSAGISAQSVGAGGGKAGGTFVNQFQATTGNTTAASIVVGGGGAYNVGNGGAVTATNAGSISTAGDAGFGIFAQSVGGGGGEAMVTASSYATILGIPALSISLGGFNGTMGDGGAVNVNLGGSSPSSITTSGNDAVGVVAQSVGGGGGAVVVMQTAGTQDYISGMSRSVTSPQDDPNGSLANVNVGNGTISSALVTPNFCKQVADGKYIYNACGDGGAIGVTTTANSSVSTSGRDAHGILAQSIGGGGGWIAGLNPENVSPFNRTLQAGEGGDINLSLAGNITTTGDGAYGVLAQSVGGGGVLGGDLATAVNREQFPHTFYDGAGSPEGRSRYGNGGFITIGNSGSIVTSGQNAHAIFAQSIGGGGGLYGAAGNNVFMSYSGGAGNATAIAITNSGLVQASGSGSSAIYTSMQGQNDSSNVTITNVLGGVIEGNPSAPVITLTGGNQNGDGTVVNSGSIWASNPNGSIAGTVAISAPDGTASVSNKSTGQIRGDIDVGAAGAVLNEGYWATADSSTAFVTNTGILDVNGAADWAPTPSVINGTLTNTGTIKQSVDFYNNLVTHLVVNGMAAIDGTLLIKPDTLANTSVTTMSTSAPGLLGLGSDFAVRDASNYLFTYEATLDAASQNLSVKPFSMMVTQAINDNLTANESAVAGNLESSFNQGTLSATQGAALAQMNNAVTNATQYAAALDSFSSETAQAASVAHVVASNAFVERMNSCPRFEGVAQDTREHDCAWGRVITSSGDRDAGGNSVGYHQSGNVFQLGGQKEVATDWFVGGSVSADNSSLATQRVSDSVSGHGWTAGAVVKHQMGDWLVSAALEGGEMSYNSSRQVPLANGTARAQFDVSHWGLHSRISKQFAFQDWYLKPYMDLHATHIETAGYTERGAGAMDLQVRSSDTNVFGASPMIEAGSNFVFGNGMSLQLYGGVGATFYNRGTLGADMQFADGMPGAGSFHITSDLPSDRFKTTAGLDWKASEHWDARLEYSGEFASHFQSNTGALKVSYKF